MYCLRTCTTTFAYPQPAAFTRPIVQVLQLKYNCIVTDCCSAECVVVVPPFLYNSLVTARLWSVRVRPLSLKDDYEESAGKSSVCLIIQTEFKWMGNKCLIGLQRITRRPLDVSEFEQCCTRSWNLFEAYK